MSGSCSQLHMGRPLLSLALLFGSASFISCHWEFYSLTHDAGVNRPTTCANHRLAAPCVLAPSHKKTTTSLFGHLIRQQSTSCWIEWSSAWTPCVSIHWHYQLYVVQRSPVNTVPEEGICSSTANVWTCYVRTSQFSTCRTHVLAKWLTCSHPRARIAVYHCTAHISYRSRRALLQQ